MTSIRETYLELLSLAQLYLLQEYAMTDRLPANSSDYTYFREYALKQSKQNPPVKSASPPPSPPSIKPVAIPSATIPKSPPVEIKRSPLPSPPAPAPIQVDAPKKSSEAEIVKESPKTPIKENTFFALEPLKPAAPLDLIEMRKTASEHLPGLALLNTIPDDLEARQRANAWEHQTSQPNVIILSFDDVSKHQAFLANIGKALAVCGFTSRVIRAGKVELDNGWDQLLQSEQLRLVIGSDVGITSLPRLHKNYREAAKTAKHYIGNAPLLLLSDISFYLKEPALKPSLWKAIKELLNNSSI